MSLYAGKQLDGLHHVSNNAAMDVMNRLITPISGTGRNLTIDNWYTSVALVEFWTNSFRGVGMEKTHTRHRKGYMRPVASQMTT